MPYNLETGNVHDWGNGQYAGIPYHLWYEYWGRYPDPVAVYAAVNKPPPFHDNDLTFPDGSVWKIRFSYSDPWSYTTKAQMSPGIPTPDNPQVPIGPVVTNPNAPVTTAPPVTGTDTTGPPVTIGTIPTVPGIPATGEAPTTTEQPSMSDAGALLGVGLLAGIGGMLSGHNLRKKGKTVGRSVRRQARKQKTVVKISKRKKR